MDDEPTLRREHLLRNPAVLRFLSLLDGAKHSFVVDGVQNPIISVFAVGSSGRDGSRDIDLDIVFQSNVGFNDEGPLPILSTQLENLAIQANRYSEKVFSNESQDSWPSKHLPLVVWPVYATQFEYPKLFRTQLPADFLRCDGGGGIANLIHLNEMLQTGATLWSATGANFRIEQFRNKNPINAIPTHEAVEYFAISTRDLAKAYLLESTTARDYLLAKAVLRAVYAFCVSCAGIRIDGYDFIPDAFLSQLEAETRVGISLREKLGEDHPVSKAVRDGLSQLENSLPMILEAVRVWRTRGIFNEDVSTQVYLLFTEIRRFVELVFATTERFDESIKALAQYQQRTIPELVNLLLSSQKAQEDPIAYQFAQELSLIDSAPKGVHEIGNITASSDYWKDLKLDSHEERLALQHFDLWWDADQADKFGIEASAPISRVKLIFDTNRRLKAWYENSMDALMSMGNYAEALHFQRALDRVWKGRELFRSRQKYVYENSLNVHWVVDVILAHVEPSARNEALCNVLDIFSKLPVSTRLQREEESPPSTEASVEDIWRACQDSLDEYNLWPDGFDRYLSSISIPSIYKLAQADQTVPHFEFEMNKGSHPIMAQFHTAHQLSLGNFSKASELKKAGQVTEALKYLEVALLCEPNWGAAHVQACAWYLESGNEDKAIAALVKAAAIGTRFAPRDEVRAILMKAEQRSALLHLLEKHTVEEHVAVEEKLFSNMKKLAWLHTYLTMDGIVNYSYDLGSMPDEQMPKEPELRQIFLTPIEWTEIDDLIDRTPLHSGSKELNELVTSASKGLGEMDPRVTDFKDLANWSAVVLSRGLAKGKNSEDEISPEAFGLVLPEKNRAQASLQEGQFKEVVNILAPMEKFHLLLSKDYLCLGQALLALSRPNDAQKALEKGYRLKPEDIRFVRNIASLYRLRGDINAALDRCQKALLLQPDYCNLHLTIADLYDDLNDHQQQIEYLKSASLCTDLDPANHWMIVNEFRSQGLLLDACVVCLRMLVKGGNNAKLKAALKALIMELGKAEDSTVAGFLHSEVQTAWEDPNELLRLGALYDDAEDFENAIRCYRRCVELDPKMAPGYFNMGNTYKDMGDHNREMLESYGKAVEINPTNAEFVSGLALAHKKVGNFKQAIALFARALNLNPNHDGDWTTLGNCYLEVGDLQEALKCHKRAVELDPNQPLNLQNLAGTYLRLENWHEAIEVSMESLKRWRQVRIFRTIATVALLDGNLSLTNYPNLLPDFVTAIQIAMRRGWIRDLKNYSPVILNVFAVIGQTLADVVEEDIKPHAQLLPIWGFNIAFCERRLLHPLFDPKFLQLNLWDPEELLSKVVWLRKQKGSVNILNTLGEFMEEYSSMQKTQHSPVLLNQIPHAIEGLMLGYHLFHACFPEAQQ